MMSPVGFPGNLLPHRCPLTPHISLKEGEEEGGPTDLVTLTPSPWPTWTTSLRCVEAAGRKVKSRGEVSRAVRSGSRNFKVNGAGGSWGDEVGMALGQVGVTHSNPHSALTWLVHPSTFPAKVPSLSARAGSQASCLALCCTPNRSPSLPPSKSSAHGHHCSQTHLLTTPPGTPPLPAPSRRSLMATCAQRQV